MEIEPPRIAQGPAPEPLPAHYGLLTVATLSDAVKAFIVTNLACWDTPSQVAEAVAEAFNLKVNRMQVAYYDPTSATGGKPAKRWRQMFEAAREEFVKGVTQAPIAHQSYRIRQLQRAYDTAVRIGNLVLARDLLKQAAEEMGGKFTNHHVLEGKLDADHQVSGVLRVPELAALKDWADIARASQAALGDAAKAATEAALPHVGAGSGAPSSGS